MSGFYFEDTSATNINDIFTVLSTALTDAGWTKTVLNSNTGAAFGNGYVAREEHFKNTGDANVAGGGHIALMRCTDSAGTRQAIQCWSWLGQKSATISTITRAGSTVTVVTTTPHGFSSGDIFSLNGTSNESLFHNFATGFTETSLPTINVTAVDTFTYTQSGTAGSA